MASSFAGFTVAATLPLIGRSFNVDSSQLGLVLSAYVAGIGIFQILAGFGSLKWGTREVYLWGLALVGAAGLLSGFSDSILVLATLRFLVGIGSGVSGATAFSLLASYYPAGEKGKSIGLYSGITNGLGGVIGLPAATAMGLAYGWPFPLELTGSVTLITAFVSVLILPKRRTPSGTPHIGIIWSNGRSVLKSRSIWALSFGLAGFVAAAAVPVDYITQYFNIAHPLWGIATAAEIAAIGTAFTLPGAILGGRIAESGYDRRAILAICGALFGGCWFVFPHLELAFIFGLYAIGGTLVGIISSVMNTIPAYLEESKGENVTLGIGVISTTQFLFTSVFVILFGVVSVGQGFTFAWMLSGLVAVILLPLLSLVAPTRGQFYPQIESSKSTI